MKKELSKEIVERLKEPFPKEAYSSKAGAGGLTSVKAYYITERLNDVFGIGKWWIDTEIIVHDERNVIVKGEMKFKDYDIKVTPQFGGAKKGYVSTKTKKWVDDTDPGDAYKKAVTSAQSKIASYLGVACEIFQGKVKVVGSNVISEKATKEEIDKAIEILNKSKTIDDLAKAWGQCGKAQLTPKVESLKNALKLKFKQ